MTTQQPLTLGFIGCGAIGSVFAYLWKNHRCYHASMSQQHRGNITRDIYDITQSPQNIDSIHLPEWQGQKLDWLMLTTKAVHTLGALRDIQHYLPQISRIVLIQNGMGQQEQVADWLDLQNNVPELWVGSTTNGAYRQDNKTYYAGAGDTIIGRFTQSNAPTPEIPQGCMYSTNPVTILREKLAVNAVINPITANAQCLNGELLTNNALNKQACMLSNEVERLYKCLEWKLRFSVYEKVAEIADKTANNRSSTLQDIDAQRTTELEYITGYLLRHAKARGIDVDLMKELHFNVESKIK